MSGQSSTPHPLYDNSVVKWIDYRMPVFSMLRHSADEYPTPKNLNYFWNFGSLAGFCLVIMIATGLFLAMNYVSTTEDAFASVERIRRDVNFGWLIQYMHINGASFFFIVVYIHIFRGLYYGSYKAPRELLWMLGVVILLLMMATAFTGYVLPWGQMSLWGAVVITNLFTAFPLIGDWLLQLLLGGFTVDNPTLNRFFAFHFVLPFAILGVVVLHIVALHTHGSNNPTGIDTKGPQDSIPFHPYYTVKDLYGVGVFLLIYCAFVFYAPMYLAHPDNWNPADPLVTPAHIVPEWYFLPFYAMLRAVTFDIGIGDFTLIDAKFGGVLVMFGSIIVLFFLPWLDRSPVRSANYRPLYKIAFWVFVVNSVILSYVGALPADVPFYFYLAGYRLDFGVNSTYVGQVATLYYFAYFLIIMPFLPKFEKTKPTPESISAPVLGGGPAASAAAAKPMDKAE